jgi:hypothetical protein
MLLEPLDVSAISTNRATKIVMAGATTGGYERHTNMIG